jgi:hypothetical protein
MKVLCILNILTSYYIDEGKDYESFMEVEIVL